jgi:hypothetical protein
VQKKISLSFLQKPDKKEIFYLYKTTHKNFDDRIDGEGGISYMENMV